MRRERALKIVLVLVGLLFTAGIYPLAMTFREWHAGGSDTGDDMMLSLYVMLGIFLLLAVRHPAAHRSLIAFAAWSSFAHALVMGSLGFRDVDQKAGFLWGSAALVVIGGLLLALAPGKPVEERAATAVG